MHKRIWTMMMTAAVLTCAVSAWAEEPKPEPADEAPGVEQRQQQRKEAFRAAVSEEDYDKALSVLDEMIADKEVSEDEKFMAGFFQFRIYALEKHDGAKACPIAEKLSERRKDDPELLNFLAWTIIDEQKLKNRDLNVALAIAKQAAEASDHENAAVLDTLARAYFEKGDLDKAVEIQTQAVEKSKNDPLLTDEVKSQVQATMEKYKTEKQKKQEDEKKSESDKKAG